MVVRVRRKIENKLNISHCPSCRKPLPEDYDGKTCDNLNNDVYLIYLQPS